ncbi:MAG: aldehyde dehydrogenase family protein [Acidimicrobiia bacterium]
MAEILNKLAPGTPIVYGGNRVTTVPDELAASFEPGDRLIVVQDTGDLLHVPAVAWSIASGAVDNAVGAFADLGLVTDDQISGFFRLFADRLEDDDVFSSIALANEADVESAKRRDRSTTRLVLTDRMRHDMVNGLRTWAATDGGRGHVVSTIHHDEWELNQIRSGLGVVGFVFEGRPNVVADATGVIRGGNTVVLRIGSDALGTARAIIQHALDPALSDAGLPIGTVSLVDTSSRAAGWAMFSDPRLGLAVARGSGPAVSQLGSVARQAGIAVSLHGTGGAWIVASETADPDHVASAVVNSLDRKVCNTLNTMCVVGARAEDIIPVFLEALDRAGAHLGTSPKLHVTSEARSHVPESWFVETTIERASGPVSEPKTELIDGDSLGVEWEWEGSPEVTLTVVPNVETAVAMFNEQSPHFAASLISSDPQEHDRFFETVDAPFVGNGFTRWVDGQYALNRPELGLSNWQFGRLFGRGGILTGDSVFTIRGRATQFNPDLGR